MIFHKIEALVLFSNAVFYMQYSCVQASLSTLFTRIYGLNEMQVGLSYLAFGIACAIASYGVGMDSLQLRESILMAHRRQNHGSRLPHYSSGLRVHD